MFNSRTLKTELSSTQARKSLFNSFFNFTVIESSILLLLQVVFFYYYMYWVLFFVRVFYVDVVFDKFSTKI